MVVSLATWRCLCRSRDHEECDVLMFKLVAYVLNFRATTFVVRRWSRRRGILSSVINRTCSYIAVLLMFDAVDILCEFDVLLILHRTGDFNGYFYNLLHRKR